MSKEKSSSKTFNRERNQKSGQINSSSKKGGVRRKDSFRYFGHSASNKWSYSELKKNLSTKYS